MLTPEIKLYSSEERIIIWANENFDEKQLKLFLFDITSSINNYALAKKYNVPIDCITFARQFSDTLSHYVIDKILKREQQKEEPVRLFYFNVA